MADTAGHSQTDDNSLVAEHGSAAVKIILSGDLKPLVWLFVATLLALAITLPVSAFAIFTAIHAGTAAENYASDKRVTENHVMHLEAELDVLKKETTNARSYPAR